MKQSAPSGPSRPLSPHLQVYRPQLTSFMSIMHRATGAALSIGLLMLIWWLAAAMAGPDAYAVFAEFAGSRWGHLVLFGFTLCFYYHLANGIRHLIWDTGHMLDLKGTYASGYLVMLFTVAMTALTWWCILQQKGVMLP